MKKQVALSALFAVASALAGCGGGDEGADAPSPSSPPPVAYITWIGNANGETIKDGNNEDFKVRVSDRAVVSMLSGARFEGTFVDTGANLYVNNVHVGAVVAAPSITGSQIAVFKCNNGRALDFYNASSTTYSWLC